MKCYSCDHESRCTLFFNLEEGRVEKEVCVLHFILSATFHMVHKIWADLDEEQAMYRANLITSEAFAIASKEAILAAGIDPAVLETAKGWTKDPSLIIGSPTNPFTDVDKIVPCNKDN